jgi:hypothetical protein
MTDILLYIARGFLSMGDIITLSIVCNEFHHFLNKRSIINQVACYKGFPFDLSLLEMRNYERKDIRCKILDAVRNKDMRVIRRLILTDEGRAECYEDSYLIKMTIKGALELRDIETAKVILSRTNYNPDAIADIAASYGCAEIVRMMIVEQGVKVFNALLNQASFSGDTETVLLLLNTGAYNYDGAMGNAATQGHIEIVKLMLDRGAIECDFSMFAAASRGYPEIVKLMLENGATNYDECIAAAAKDSRRGNCEGIIIVELLVNAKGAIPTNQQLATSSLK